MVLVCIAAHYVNMNKMRIIVSQTNFPLCLCNNTVYGFSEVTMKLYDASRTYSADGYIAFLDTYSDHRGLPDDNRVALYVGIKEAILRHGGHHKVDYVFQLYMGRKL